MSLIFVMLNNQHWHRSHLQFEIGDEMNMRISFETLLAAVKDLDFTRKESKSKRVKRSSTSSRSEMDRIGCHVCIYLVTFILNFIAQCI